MKELYTDVVVVDFPYLTTNDDQSTSRRWATMRFKAFEGKVDRRRVKREVRKWIKRTLERNVSSYELRKILKRAHRETSEGGLVH